MKAEGHFDDKIVFYFYDSSDSDKPSKHKITDFFIQEKIGESEWSTIWDLSGSARLNSIEYGQNHDGLTERKTAETFKKNVKYRATAYDLPIFDARGSAGILFYFDQDGNLIVVDDK